MVWTNWILIRKRRQQNFQPIWLKLHDINESQEALQPSKLGHREAERERVGERERRSSPQMSPWPLLILLYSVYTMFRRMLDIIIINHNVKMNVSICRKCFEFIGHVQKINVCLCFHLYKCCAEFHTHFHLLSHMHIQDTLFIIKLCLWNGYSLNWNILCSVKHENKHWGQTFIFINVFVVY